VKQFKFLVLISLPEFKWRMISSFLHKELIYFHRCLSTRELNLLYKSARHKCQLHFKLKLWIPFSLSFLLDLQCRLVHFFTNHNYKEIETLLLLTSLRCVWRARKNFNVLISTAYLACNETFEDISQREIPIIAILLTQHFVRTLNRRRAFYVQNFFHHDPSSHYYFMPLSWCKYWVQLLLYILTYVWELNTQC